MVPPERTMLLFLTFSLHFMMELKQVLWIPADSTPGGTPPQEGELMNNTENDTENSTFYTELLSTLL